ncbi:hypothetical protein BDY17DRAFT_79016 [Neohortaea acidophila]|uniref:Tat pathway signal sequence n=1 Tax=Neohortaea acidophila TaxID=245834 RepID=A0A6A6Q2A2_9PEZI|nr:uncharacterized protein BDY17DRAFT_79016 [Neohortaea acidophila]KAF2486435.1 hypothetical protein BDY17DRAFT_79016 [Neohortaea acidophila]
MCTKDHVVSWLQDVHVCKFRASIILAHPSVDGSAATLRFSKISSDMTSTLSHWKKHLHGKHGGVGESDESLLKTSQQEEELPARARRPERRWTYILSLAVNVFLFIVLLSLTISSPIVKTVDLCQQIYTPVESIDYSLTTWDLSEPSIEDDWTGPATPERNKRWKALHDVGRIRLSKDQAARLHNKTAAAQYGPGEDYPVLMNVFHDLHCLDSLRLMTAYLLDSDHGWNATYNPYTLPWPNDFHDGPHSLDYAYHCFNALRLSIQCASDVTPIVFQYRQDLDIVVNSFAVTHTCRNFDAIRSWALEHSYREPFERDGPRDHQGLCNPDGC